MDKAITQLTQQQPSIFDFNNKICENCYYVKNEARVRRRRDQEPQRGRATAPTTTARSSAVKNSNSFNDQYDILVSSGHIRRGDGLVPEHLQPVLVLRRQRGARAQAAVLGQLSGSRPFTRRLSL